MEADGKTVVLNSKETIESVKYMVGFWKDAHDEGGLAWDDSSVPVVAGPPSYHDGGRLPRRMVWRTRLDRGRGLPPTAGPQTPPASKGPVQHLAKFADKHLIGRAPRFWRTSGGAGRAGFTF